MLDSLLVAHYIPMFESFVAGDVSEVEFEPTEPFVSLKVTRRDGDGDEVMVKGYVEHPLEGESEELAFTFETSVSNVTRFLEGLQAIADAYLIRDL